MDKEEEAIERVQVLEVSWVEKTSEVKQLLKWREGPSLCEHVSSLRQQITEIEEELLNLPAIRKKGYVTLWGFREENNENT